MSDLNRSQVMVVMILSLQELITELDHKITEGCYSTHDSYLERFPHSGSIGRSQTLQSRRRGCKEMEDQNVKDFKQLSPWPGLCVIVLTEVVADSYCEVEEHVPSVAGDSSHLEDIQFYVVVIELASNLLYGDPFLATTRLPLTSSQASLPEGASPENVATF